MIEIWNLIIQAGILLGAFITIFIGVFGNWKKKQQEALLAQQEAHDKQMAELKIEYLNAIEHISLHHKEDTNDLKMQLLTERADRVEKTARLHARIDEMQNEMIGGLRSGLSKIQGQLEGVSNILKPIQDWFINGGPNQKSS